MRAQKGISEFEKSFWKLSVNSVFGKQMENIRKRFQPMKFVTTGNSTLPLFARTITPDSKSSTATISCPS